MQFKAPRFNNFEFTFERVSVVLGANGSGKSRFLRDLRDAIPSLTDGSKAVFIEGGRTITIQDVLQLDARNFQHYDRLESAERQWENKRAKSLADRVFDALVVLEKRDLQLKARHSDAVEQWQHDGGKGPYPVRPRAPLARLFDLFSEIFPQITLSFDHDARRLTAHKHGEKYGPSGLSDGEKQVLSILADLIELDAAHKVIIADEPELNLHPELAERLWSLVENEFPDKTFIYATHSINFALRSNVERVFVLASNSDDIAEFTGLESLPRSEVRAFLGGLPGILSTDSVVVVEGDEKSFDAIFFRWLLDDAKVEVYPAGGCTDVVDVATKSGLWSRISSNVILRGVVDADFRSDEHLAALESRGVTVLALHEAESYLCVPEIAEAIAARIGSQEKPLLATEVAEAIFDALAGQRLAIAARRVIAQSGIQLGVSVERKVLSAIGTRDELLGALEAAAVGEIEKAKAVLGAATLGSALDRELATIDRILASRDVLGALRLLPAKALLHFVARRAGCKNASDLMRSLRANFKPTDFEVSARAGLAIVQQSSRTGPRST